MSPTPSDDAAATAAELVISGSNKRPWSGDDDDDDWHWMNSLNALQEAYKMISSSAASACFHTSDNLFSIMIRGSMKVKRLLSKEAELEIDDQLIDPLKQLVASFEDLLPSVRKLGTEEENYPEKLRLVRLAKHILRGWEAIENAIPEPGPGSSYFMADIDYPIAVPSAWLFEYHWRDNAHKEVLSIRKKHSYLLDQAYRSSYTSYLRKRGTSGSIALSHKKLLNFMASSREDFEFLDVKKCYKRVMSIKKLYTKDIDWLRDQEKDVKAPSYGSYPRGSVHNLNRLKASEKLTDQTKLPNWRDDIYDQVAAYRKMYSLELDKLLRDEVVNKMQSATPDKADKERRSFLDESLQFLASSRDVIAILKEENCRKKLAVIKHRLEESEDFLSAKQSAATTPTNWRDLEYMALQYKSFRFTYEVHDVYLIHQPVWSQIPECNEDLKKLESHMRRAFQTYRMRRGEMSLIASKDEYYDLCSGSLKEDVEACIGLTKLLLEKGGTRRRWDIHRPELLIPKPCKFAQRLSLNNIAVPMDSC